MTAAEFEAASKLLARYKELKAISDTMVGAHLQFTCKDIGGVVRFPTDKARKFLASEMSTLATQLTQLGVTP